MQNKNDTNLDFKKFIFILLGIFIPIIGQFLILRSNRFKKTGKIIAGIWLMFFIFLFSISYYNGDVDNEIAKNQPEKENVNEINFTEKSFVELGNEITNTKDSSLLYKIIQGDKDFREPFIKRWNYTLNELQEDMEKYDENKIDKNWWQSLKLKKVDIEKKDMQGWKETNGCVYNVVFGNSIKIDMTIYNPPAQELKNENPSLNKFRISIGLKEDFSEMNSINSFLAKRRQAVQTMDLALRTVFGKNNYNKEKLYNYVSDFKEDGWAIERSDLDFKQKSWGYRAENNFNNYLIALEVDETGEYPSEFYMIMDFEL